MQPPIRRLAFVVNEQKSGASELAADLVTLATAAGVETRITRAYPLPAAHLSDVDACCVTGGDGTLVDAAPAAALAGVPLIGSMDSPITGTDGNREFLLGLRKT